MIRGIIIAVLGVAIAATGYWDIKSIRKRCGPSARGK